MTYPCGIKEIISFYSQNYLPRCFFFAAACFSLVRLRNTSSSEALTVSIPIIGMFFSAQRLNICLRISAPSLLSILLESLWREGTVLDA